jgi:hypothetical protein
MREFSVKTPKLVENQFLKPGPKQGGTGGPSAEGSCRKIDCYFFLRGHAKYAKVGSGSKIS